MRTAVEDSNPQFMIEFLTSENVYEISRVVGKIHLCMYIVAVRKTIFSLSFHIRVGTHVLEPCIYKYDVCMYVVEV